MKKTLLLFVLLGFLIGACSKKKNSDPFSYVVNNIGDFSMKPGDTAYMNLEVKLIDGTPDDVNLGIEGLPPDVTATFASAGSVPTYNSVIMFVAKASAVKGIFPIKLTSASIMGTRKENFKLTISENGDTTTHGDPFTYAVNNVNDISIAKGNSGNMGLEVKLLTGTAENVALSVVGLPTGVTSGFSKTSGMPTYNSTLTLNVANNAAAGTYPVTVKSTATSGAQSYAFNLTVTGGTTGDPFNFAVNGVNDLTVQQGNSGTLNLSVALTTGTTENVALSVTGLPSGATGSFSSASGNPTFSSTLTVNVTAAAATGTYPVTVKAVSATAGTKTYNFNLKVTAGTTGGDCAADLADTYVSQDSCTQSAGAPVVTKTGSNAIKIANLAGYLTYMVDATGTVNCNTHTITIPSQAIAAIPIPGATISGTGTFTDNTITIHYTITVLTFNQTCKVDMTR